MFDVNWPMYIGLLGGMNANTNRNREEEKIYIRSEDNAGRMAKLKLKILGRVLLTALGIGREDKDGRIA